MPTPQEAPEPADASADARAASDAPVHLASTAKESPNARHPSADAVTIRRTVAVPTSPPWLRTTFTRLPERVREWAGDPDFSIFFLAFMVVAAALYLRQPSGVGGGFVFDEQEAILANPFVRGHQPWMDAFKRDFWGLLPDRSIGSYRPIPNLLWRALWRLQEWRTKGTGGAPINTPFVWFNLVFHATNAALLASLVRGVYQRVSTAWLAGAIFCACAVTTEAVSGIVGIADVLGGLSLLLCLSALRLSPAMVLVAVFGATEFGLLSKETAIVNVGLVPLAALILAPSIDPRRPQAILRTLAAFVGAAAAIGVYAVIRHRYFHLDLPLDDAHGALGKLAAKLKHYIGAPNLPVDPFNNPLADPAATTGQRVGGALRVYARGVGQVVFPNRLSPDYSLPQEPLPARAVFPESILGALLMIVPPLVGAWLLLRGEREHEQLLGARTPATRPAWLSRLFPRRVHSDERSLLGYCLLAWPAAFFPVSNVLKTLPTVRAERFWYTPALATSIAIALLFAILARRSPRWWYAIAAFATVFLGFQAVRARGHANHFKDDLSFWKAASEAVPNSAKAHLNYSVMLGARAPEIWGWTTTQAQQARLIENERAAELAPHWDMAFIYVGDTLCQLNRLDEAWGWYVKGFRIGPQNSGLIALALQCLSDHSALLAHEKEADALVAEPEMSGSWLAYLVRDTLDRERKCRGVDAEEDSEWLLGTDADADESAEPETDGSATATASASASASSSASPSSSSSAAASAQNAVIDPASASASASASVSASAKPAPVRPPCGVDPKYRPRGLDGDPKGD